MNFISKFLKKYNQIKSIKETIQNDEITIVKNANDLEELFSSLVQKTIYNKECIQDLVSKIESENDSEIIAQLKNHLIFFDTENNKIIDIIKRSISVSDSTKDYKHPEQMYSENTMNHIKLTQKTGSKLSKLLVTAEECKSTVAKYS